MERGFTLVELSIVLIIVGFLIAGVSGGSSLVQTAKFNSIITYYTDLQQSTNTFRSIYNAIPGDFDNATAHWYDATNCPGTNKVAGSCNGNNNGSVSEIGGPNSNESLRFWQHLNYAKINTYILSAPGTGLGTGNEFQIGVNVPALKNFNGVGCYISGATAICGKFNTNTQNYRPFLTAVEASLIDKKIDDGYPLLGRVKGWHPDFGWPNCRSSGGSNPDVYTITDNVNQFCTMQFTIIDN